MLLMMIERLKIFSQFINLILIILLILISIFFYLADTSFLRNLSLTQSSGNMNKLLEKSEQHQSHITMNVSLDNQSLQGDSLSAVSCDQVCNCEQQQSDPYLQVKQELTPDLSYESEQPASNLNLLTHHDQQYEDDKTIISTQHHEYQADIPMASSKGKFYHVYSFIF